MEKVFLEEALPKLQQRYSFNLVEHFPVIRSRGQMIFWPTRFHLSPQEFWKLQIYAAIARQRQIFPLGFAGFGRNSDGLLFSTVEICRVRGRRGRKRRAVEREAKEGRESVLQFAEVFANKPWARTHVSAVAKEHPYWR